MDESDVSASVASPADYIPYFSLALDHLVSTSIDAYAAISTAHLPGEKKRMMPKLRPSCADSVTTISWSPWPKPWVGNHYRQARGFYYPVRQASFFNSK